MNRVVPITVPVRCDTSTKQRLTPWSWSSSALATYAPMSSKDAIIDGCSRHSSGSKPTAARSEAWAARRGSNRTIEPRQGYGSETHVIHFRVYGTARTRETTPRPRTLEPWEPERCACGRPNGRRERLPASHCASGLGCGGATAGRPLFRPRLGVRSLRARPWLGVLHGQPFSRPLRRGGHDLDRDWVLGLHLAPYEATCHANRRADSGDGFPGARHRRAWDRRARPAAMRWALPLCTRRSSSSVVGVSAGESCSAQSEPRRSGSARSLVGRVSSLVPF
jgi:hypothetical protein